MSSKRDHAELLDAVGRAKAFRLCLRRVWAVAASLPERENSLPNLIPVPDMFSVPGHDRQHHEHEQCTFDFCEHSRVDFTSVAQHHERCGGDCGHFRFPLQILEDRVREGKPTAWKLDDRSLLDTSHPYMAVSHVWADGTGAGTWGPGLVNKCLYTFLSRIARDFQCEGFWWDAISIPLDKDVRGQALRNMQNNYADASITLVHDLYLREWEWVDAETACFAIVMSPWYSRGWTALELAKSHKVKILFKAKNDGYVIKDLDIDILAKVQRSSRYHATAESIRKLRIANIQSFGDLLAILGPRDTSKPRDVSIISGLLAGVDVSGGLTQQDIYQRILRKLGKVAQGHLFHNSATMSAPGFSWCPTNILDMPIAENDSALLKLGENGDLEGFWRVYPIDSVKPDDFIWKGTHPLTQVELESSLNGKNREKHLLLIESERPRSRALIVRFMGMETTAIICRFVGPVYFRSNISDNNGDSHVWEANVRIGNANGMPELPQKAWDCVPLVGKYMKKVSFLENVVVPPGGMLSSEPQYSFIEDDPLGINSKDFKAILYLQDAESGLSLMGPNTLQIPKDTESKLLDMSLCFINGNNRPGSAITTQMLFYGNQGIIQDVEAWLSNNSEFTTGRMMLLALDEDRNINCRLGDNETIGLLASDALLLVTENGADSRVEPLVTLLLDNHAKHALNHAGQTPLHLALAHGHNGIAEKLLSNELNPASADMADAERQRAIHIAAKKGCEHIVGLLVARSSELNAQDREERTALHLAVENGRGKIARLLLRRGADPNIRDTNGQTALHLAADNGHESIASILVDSGANISIVNNHDETVLLLAARKGLKNVVAALLTKGADVNHQDSKRRTALHWAAIRCNVDIIQLLIGSLPHLGTQALILIHKKDYLSRTALHWAACSGSAIATDLILTAGAHRNALDIFRRSALILAAKNGRVAVVNLLLSRKSKLKLQGIDGKTALDWAAAIGSEKVVCALVPNIGEDKAKQRALELAANGGHTQAAMAIYTRIKDSTIRASASITILFSASATPPYPSELDGLIKDITNLNQTDKQHRTALMLAVKNRNHGLTEKLLGLNAKTNLQDVDGTTALIIATRLDDYDIVEKLLRASADPDIQDNRKYTALHYAVEHGSLQSLDYLLSGKANSNIPDFRGRTALHVAMNQLQPGSCFTSFAIQKRESYIRLLEAYLWEQLVELEKVVIPGTDWISKPSLRWAEVLLPSSKRDSLPWEVDSRQWPVVLLAWKRDLGNFESNLQLRKKELTTFEQNVREHLQGLVEDAASKSLDNTSRPLEEDLQRWGLDLKWLWDVGLRPWEVEVRPWEIDLRPGERAWWTLLERDANQDIRDEEGRTALHWAVLKNREDVVDMLLKRPRPPNKEIKDAEGRTPLLIATERGHTDLVRFLLTSDFDPNAQDKMGRTPLLLAVDRGDSISVDALLVAKADPNLADHRGRTALSEAALNGRDEIVQKLFATENEKLNIDARDVMGRTALLLAAENGHNTIVERLLHHKANSTTVDYEGKKAWQKAMSKGHASVVKTLLSTQDKLIQDRKAINDALLLASRKGWVTLVDVLLEKEADPTFQGRGGRTALHMAVMSGHREVINTLFQKGINIINKDHKRRTALMQATEHGFESIVGLLVEKKEVKANIHDWMGREALLFAAETGYDGIIEQLLQTNVDCNFADAAGRTAMILAAANGNTTIVELLLRQGASSTINDHDSRTALHHAAWGGHEDVVETLLKCDVNLGVLDNRGNSALHLAAERASKKVVEQLLEKRANTNLKSTDGQTALHRAAWGGSSEIVVLLRRYGADHIIRDDSGNKPWQVAAEKGHESIAEILLREEKDSVNDENIMKKRALIFAAQMGYQVIARSLLEKGADSAVKDADGLTPLHWAAMQGDKAMVELLIKKGKASINALDHLRRTALCHAVRSGRAAVLGTLLQNGADANIFDEKGQTVLHDAARNGNLEAVQILIGQKIDSNARNNQGNKAWQVAAENGYHLIVRLLVEKEVDLNPGSRKMEELFLRMAEGGRVSMIQLLLEKGVNKNAKDRLGRVAMNLAAEYSRDEVLELLISEGADPSISDLRLQTPLLWAAKIGNTKTIRLLLDNINDPSSEETHTWLFLGFISLWTLAISELFFCLILICVGSGPPIHAWVHIPLMATLLVITLRAMPYLIGALKHRVVELTFVFFLTVLQYIGILGALEAIAGAALRPKALFAVALLELVLLWEAGPGTTKIISSLLSEAKVVSFSSNNKSMVVMVMMMALGITILPPRLRAPWGPSLIRLAILVGAAIGPEWYTIFKVPRTVNITTLLLDGAKIMRRSILENRITYLGVGLWVIIETGLALDLTWLELVLLSMAHFETALLLGLMWGTAPLWETTTRTKIIGLIFDKAKESRANFIEKKNDKVKIVNHSDFEGQTALIAAVQQGHENAAKLLLDKGSPEIDVNLTNKMGRTALHLAAEKGNQHLVRLLLEGGGERDLQDTLEHTALLLAAEREHKQVVQILLESSADANIPNSHRRTALQIAAEQGNTDMVQELIDKGAKLDLSDQLGRTALWLAVENGKKDVVHLLLDKGASREQRDSTARTPLLLAVANGDKVLVEALLNGTVNLHDQKYCLKLLSLAQQSGNQDVISLVNSNIDFEKLSTPWITWFKQAGRVLLP